MHLLSSLMSLMEGEWQCWVSAYRVSWAEPPAPEQAPPPPPRPPACDPVAVLCVQLSARHRGSSVKGTLLCCCAWCCMCPLSSQTLVSVRGVPADSGFLCAQGCAWVLFSFVLGLGVSWWGGSFQCDVSRGFPVRL